MKLSENQTVKCSHCGLDCNQNLIVNNGKNFCCNGCQTVYELLNGNKLYTYYEIAKTPGNRVESQEFKGKFDFLANDEIKQKLFDFSDADVRKVTLYIPSIHCSSCIWLLENLSKLHSGIIYSQVHFAKKTVYITFRETEITLRQVVELLVSIHYIPQITLDNIENKQTTTVNKHLLYRLGVAGFCFGNSMLVSMPEYLPGSEFLESNFRSYFGFVNLLLALPVFFYSSSDYFLSAYKSLRKGLINIDIPITLGIVAIFTESTYEILSGIGSGYMDSLCGLLFFLLIGKWYQSKTYESLSFERDYKSYFPVSVTKLIDNQEQSTLLKNLKKGDRILVRNQELIPADSLLVKGNARIDYSFVTGESKPVDKQVGAQVYAGGRQIGSAIELVVQKEVIQSQLTQLWNQKVENKEGKTKMESLIDKISRNFTFTILFISFATACYWFVFDKSLLIKAFTSVLIVACPCAISLSIPFSFSTALLIFGRKGFYLKNSTTVEKLATIDTIVFDKTGTITYPNLLNVKYIGKELSEKKYSAIKSLVRHSTHPLSVAIYESIEYNTLYEALNYVETTSKGIEGEVETEGEKFALKIGSEEFVTGKKIAINPFTTSVYISIDKEYYGYFSFENRYRDGLKDLFEKLTKHYDIQLLSGDNDSEKQNLIEFFKDESKLRFNQSPNDKLQFIRDLQSKGKKVLMLGDGLNDAGALSESAVGVSIADNIFHFSPACDAILEAKQFADFYQFIEFSKRCKRVVYISFGISFIYNIIGLSFAVRGLLSPIIAAILMPASSVTVVAFVTFAVHLLSGTYLKSNNSFNERIM